MANIFKHPLKHVGQGDIVDANDQDVATVYLRTDVDAELRARHLVACVNACAHINTDALESWVNPPAGGMGADAGTWAQHIITLDKIARDLQAQRDKLLAALKECLATYSATSKRIPPTTQEAGRILDKIRVANERARTIIAEVEASP